MFRSRRDRGREALGALRRLCQRIGRGLQFGRSRGYGLDDLSDGAFERIGELAHIRLALLRLPLFGLELLGAQPLGFDHVVLEHLNRISHFADLVAPAEARDHQPDIAAGEPRHG